VNSEYWVVPSSGTAAIASVRAQLQPSTVAVQPVSEAYVSSAIASLSGSWLPLAGGILSGPLTLNTDPTASSQAATKHYADQLAAAQLPLAGGTLTGPLTVPSLYAKQLEGRLYADQMQNPSGGGGIANAVQGCGSAPCAVVAPPSYGLTEIPAWSRATFVPLQYSTPSTGGIFLNDIRGGENYQTLVNPYNTTNAASFDTSNVFVGNQRKVDFTGLGTSAYLAGAQQDDIANLDSALQTQGGVHSQIYDFVHQTSLRGDEVLVDRNTSGATMGRAMTLWCNAPGDCVGDDSNIFGPAGASAPFDEGIELWSHAVSQSINVYRGSLTGTPSTGATQLVIAPASRSGTANDWVAGTQGENRWLIDTQSGKSTTITGTALADDVQPFSDPAAGCQGGSCNYFTQITSSTSATPSTGWGYLTSAITVPAGSLIPGTQTFTINVSGGSFAAGLACLADEAGTGFVQHLGNFETITISGVSGSSITATMQKSHPAGGTIWQGGLCGRFAELAGSALPSGSAWSDGETGGTTVYPVRFVWPILGSIDGTHIFLATIRTAWGPLDAAWSRYSNKAITLYYGAETYKVAGANNDTSDNHFALAPNNAPWAAGDAVEQPQYPYQAVGAGVISISQWLPHTGGPKLNLQMLGRTENQDSGIWVNNTAPQSSYTVGGGTWTLPQAAYAVVGPWQYGLNLGGSSLQAAIGLPCNSSTQRIIEGNAYSPNGNHFDYNCSNSLWTLAGNLSVTGSLNAAGGVTGASINGEVTVDGTTYTTLNAAWSAALAQANSTGHNQTVRLGPGTFPVTSTLSEPSNGACVSLLGSGGTTVNADSPQVATTLTLPSSLGGDVFYLGNAAQAQGCTFKDLNLLAGGNATHGFELQWFRGALIDNVAVNDTTAEGILLGEESTASGHQANFLLHNVTVSYSSAAFTPASRPAYGIHLQKTAIDSQLDNITVRNALTAAVYNEGTGNTGYLVHGFGFPYTCTTAPCVNNASSSTAANASYATSYVIYDTGGSGSVWTDTYVDSPAVAGFYIGANGVEIHGGHVQWPDLTSFPAANLAYVASTVTNNMLIADVDCLEMAAGVNWITYAGASGNPPTYASVHHLTGCGNYYQSLEDANVNGFSSGGANVNDPTGAVPRVWSAPVASAASYPAYAAQMYTGYQGDAFQAHFSGVNPFFNVTYQGTIRSSGGLALSTVINTASTLTLTAANKNVIANAAGGTQTITLPSCYTALPDKAAPTGLEFTIIKSDTSSNAVTLQTVSSQNINYNGVSAQTLAISAPGKRTLVCAPDYNWYAY
jgi:hypothetical protein